MRFTPAGSRGEGLDAIDIVVHDPAVVLTRARERDLPIDDQAITIGGVRFNLVPA